MPGSTTSFLFPDLNVWLALSHGAHVHHDVARDWFSSASPDARFCFCRITQLGFLRLLTTTAVMGPDEVLTQRQAWNVYDAWLADDRVRLVDEPAGLDRRFRTLTSGAQAASKHWADAYLAAFAATAQVTLVTFDRAFRGRLKPLILLEETAE